MTMRKERRMQAGAVMIEMVIVTPLLLLLVLGTGEIGKALVEYNTLTKSVRDGARLVARSALLGTTGTVLITPDLEADARNLVVYGNVAGTGTPRLPNLAPGQVSVIDAGNNYVVVQADVPYEPLTGPVLETFGFGTEPSLGVTMTASVTMRAL